MATTGTAEPSPEDYCVNVFIRQLTGIRFVAAAWVLLYHLQVPLAAIHILSIPGVGDVARVGRLGVDLDFWWLRLARIYPVHLVMIVVAGVAVVGQAKVTGDDLNRDWLNPIDLLKNLLLVQEWGPEPQRGWNFVAWSLSMEWLAYLIFPLLALLLWVMHRRVATGLLFGFWAIALAPLVLYGLSTTDPYYTDNWGSTIRILTEFTAGAITYLIIVRFLPGDRLSEPAAPKVERTASVLAVVLPLIVVAGAIFLANLPAAQPPQVTIGADAEPFPPYFHLLLVPVLIAWIGSLALSRRGLTRFLSTRALVLGGFISYSLYMTHLVWFGLWRAAMKAIHVSAGPLYAVAVVGLVAGALVIAWLMWRFVEEPAREWMRSKAGARRKPTEEAGEAIAEKAPDADSATPIDVPDVQTDPFGKA
jgi:peptidoglycan/LPS O-acetylase OafA/YrhL